MATDTDLLDGDPNKYRVVPRPTATKEAIIEDLRRLAVLSGRGTVGYSEYVLQGRFGMHAVTKLFGKWNAALQEAGLRLRHRNWTEAEYRDGVKAVWDRVQHRPSYGEYAAWAPKLGCPGISALEKRFGGYPRALERFFGGSTSPSNAPAPRATRTTRRPHATGEPIHHPVMTYAPVNEPGTLALLVLMAQDLGLIIESVRTAFPDVAAKRLDPVTGRYVPVEIEVEFKSRNYVAHGHPIDPKIPIICWEHDWADCPAGIEVISLKDLLQAKRKAV